jgi:intein/homing endonuclease
MAGIDLETIFNLLAYGVSKRKPSMSESDTIPTVADLEARVQELYASESSKGEVREEVSTAPVTEGKATSIVSGCIPCMPPDSLIWGNPSIMQIKDISEGQKVIAADGRLTQVLKTMSRGYEGDLVSITIPGQNMPILLTPEHPVLAIRATGCKKNEGQTLCFPKENEKCLECSHRYEAEWTPAGELTTKGKKNVFSKHIVLMPRFTETEDIEKLDTFNLANVKPAYIRNDVKAQVLVNTEFMKLLGYYLAEGSVVFQERGALIRFDFGSKEIDLVEEVKNLIDTVFGLKAKVDTGDGTLRIWVSSVILGHLLVNLVGTGSHNKYIPFWILKLPVIKQKALLHGFWNGDGSRCLSYGRQVMAAGTSSFQLAFALRLLLHRAGILHHLGKTQTRPSSIKGRKIKSGTPYYQIQLNSNYAVRLLELFGEKVNYKFVQSSQIGIDERWIYLPIKKISRLHYKGPVSNIETISQNYCVNGVIVHNCSIGHLGTCSGLLNEAMRFARKDGVQSGEVIDRVNMCLDELNALERVDLRPEMIHDLPDWEKSLAEKALDLSRSLRHDLEGISDTSTLEGISAKTQTTRQKIGKAWFKERFSRLPPEQRKVVESKLREKAAEQVGELT